jgi:hypothetical protein
VPAMRPSLALAGMLLAAAPSVLAQETTATIIASSAPPTTEVQTIIITPTPTLEGSASRVGGDIVVITSIVTPSRASVASSNGKHYHPRLKHDRRADESCRTEMFHWGRWF